MKDIELTDEHFPHPTPQPSIQILASRRRGDVTMESLVVQQLKEFGYTDASQDCYVQSFELETFKYHVVNPLK